MVKPGDPVEVVVLDINREKQEISLGLKQTENNPWDQVEKRFPPGTMIEGEVRNLTNYGAFVELAEGIDGLLHVSDMSWTKKIAHPSEVYQKGVLKPALWAASAFAAARGVAERLSRRGKGEGDDGSF